MPRDKVSAALQSFSLSKAPESSSNQSWRFTSVYNTHTHTHTHTHTLTHTQSLAVLLALVLALLSVSAPAQAVDGGVFVPAVRVVSVFPLVAFVVVPVTRGVVALGAGVRLLARVPQHVPLQVHALVAGVAAHAAVERLGARVDALVPPKVGEVSAGVAAGRALVRLLARVHAQVALEVVEVRGGVGAVRAAVGFLLGVGVGVAGQVVGVVGQEGAVRAAVQLLATLASPGSTRRGRAAGRPGPVFRQQVQRAATTHLKIQTERTSVIAHLSP